MATRELTPGVFEGGTPVPAQAAVPTVSRRQAFRALNDAGLLALIESTINAIEPESARTAAQIDWATATEFRRDFPLLLQLANAIGLTPAQIDNLFAAAAAIP